MSAVARQPLSCWTPVWTVSWLKMAAALWPSTVIQPMCVNVLSSDCAWFASTSWQLTYLYVLFTWVCCMCHCPVSNQLLMIFNLVQKKIYSSHAVAHNSYFLGRNSLLIYLWHVFISIKCTVPYCSQVWGQ